MMKLLGVLLFLFTTSVVSAITISFDSVHIYLNGKKVLDDSVIWQASYKTHFDLCTEGICYIGQQFYPVTLYKIDGTGLITYEKYVDNHIKSNTAYSRNDYDNNLKALMDKAEYKVTINPPPSKNDGRAAFGTNRRFSFDMKTNHLVEIPLAVNVWPIQIPWIWVISLSFVFLTVFVSALILKIVNKKTDQSKK